MINIQQSKISEQPSLDMKKALTNSIIFFFISLPIILILLFIPAGTLNWINAWIFFGITVIDIIIRVILLYKYNPELLIERLHRHKGTKSFDKYFQFVYTLSTFMIYVTAGLDTIRFRWSEPLSLIFLVIGIILFIISSGLITWVMISNKFFERSVRIQEERSHKVCSEGPYRYVRHPGYLSFSIMFIGTAFILGSKWSLIPVMATILSLIVRTILEDKTLQNELVGYKEYAEKVRFRLLPRVW